MQCSKCGTQYDGNFCPQGCDSPYYTSKKKKPLYKKWWFWVALALIFVVLLSAIGGENEAPVVSNDTSTGETVTTTTTTTTTTKKATTTVEPMAAENAYKKACKSIDFQTLSRNPDKYQGEKYKFTGKVIQVIEPTFSWSNTVTLRINITKEVLYGDYVSWADTIYATVEVPDDADRILVDDILTFWGNCEGMYTYETVLGNPISLPKIDIKYYRIDT